MSNFNFADCKKAVNQATFRPTAERKALAAKLLQEALDFVSSLEEVKDVKPKAKKRRRKAKRTPSQRTADHMDKQAMRTNEVGPVKPSSKGTPKADVEAARKSAEAVSKHTGAAAKAARKAEAKVEPKVEDARLTSLEEKIEMLTQLMALQMQGEPSTSVKAESLEDVPFQL